MSIKNPAFIAARAKLSKILDKTEIGKIVFANVDDVLQGVDNVINDHLKVLKTTIIKQAQMMIETSKPGGAKYVYVNPDGSVVAEHQSSSEGSPPTSFKGLLGKSIDVVIDPTRQALSVGVFKQTKHPIGSKYYIPLNPSGKTISKKNPARKTLLEYARKGFRGAVIIGTHKTPVSAYAKYLEEGFTIKGVRHSRPFLVEAVKETLKYTRPILNASIKEACRKRQGRKYVNYIRFNVTKGT